jgi:hypothetical protein
MPKIFHSGVCATVHEAMERLYAAGLIDQDEMRVFDELCLTAIASGDQKLPRTADAAASEAPRVALDLLDGPAIHIRGPGLGQR